MREMVHAEGGRGCPWISSRLPIPILCRAWRLATKYQHKIWSKCHCSHRRHRPAVHLHDICTHHISTIALPEFIFWYYLVSVPEVAWATIQGSRTRWRNQTREREHGTGSNAACN